MWFDDSRPVEVPIFLVPMRPNAARTSLAAHISSCGNACVAMF